MAAHVVHLYDRTLEPRALLQGDDRASPRPRALDDDGRGPRAVERVFERGTECLVHVIALKKKTEKCRGKGSETKLYRKEVKRGV